MNPSTGTGSALAAGRNIAVEVPPGQFATTVVFYRDVVGLDLLNKEQESAAFSFGDMKLRVDRVESLAGREVWLELQCQDPDEAAAWLADHGVTRRDEVERLPDGFPGFWIRSPSGVVHLVCAD